MRRITRFLVGCCLSACGLGALAIAAPPEPPDEPPAAVSNAVAEKTAVASEQLARWAAQLDSEQFDQREAATQALQKAGEAALDAVAAAAAGESLEASNRAFGILGRWSTGENETLRKATQQKLESLSKHANESVVRRASATLAKAQQQPQPSPAGPAEGLAIARAVPAFGRIELRVVGGLRVEGKEVRVHAVRVDAGGGSRKAEINRNGEKIVIEEDAKAGITVKITKSKDGKAQTTEYAAKNAEDLKKHAEAFKLYEQYLGKAGVKLEILGAAEPAKPDQPAEKK